MNPQAPCERSSDRRQRLSARPLLMALPLLFLLSAVSVGHGQTTKRQAAQKEEQAIRQVLDSQVSAWNRGDLLAFMAGYWRSENLTFFSSARRLRGWEATLTRYRQTYQAEGKEMGQLAFSDLDIELLGPDTAAVRGSWQLRFQNGTTSGGIYTLLFRRFGNGWKITHDHTS